MIEKKVAVLGMSMVALAVSILAIQTLYYAPMLH
jgi:hypothetical protein